MIDVLPIFNQVRLESTLDTLPFKAGSIYVCDDTGHIYFDSVIEEKRVLLTGSTIVVPDEDTRKDLENPVQNKLYFVEETELFYIFLGYKWYVVSSGTSGSGGSSDSSGDSSGDSSTSSGGVTVTPGEDGSFVIPLDDTLKKSGMAADAKAVGDAIDDLIDGAPNSLNTIGSLAQATKKNESAINNLSAESGDRVHIGATAPTSDRYSLWVDVSTTTTLLKYRNELGGWTVISGTGGGSGSSSSTNNAKLTVTNTGGWLSKTISYGATCNIVLTWSSIEDDVPTGNGTIKVAHGDVIKESYEVKQGEISINVTKYLIMGTNDIKITISDMYGNTRTLNFTISTISVSISSYFDGTLAYTGQITYNYTPVGAVSKTVYFLIDGKEIGTQVVTTSNREQTYQIPAQSHGSHKLDVYFIADFDGNPVESNTLSYDLICYESGNSTPIITTTFNEANVKQYATIAIPYYVYTPELINSSITLKEGETVINELTVDRSQQIWSYKALDEGAVELSIVCGEITKKITFNVIENDIDVEAESNNLELYLSSAGRSNNEANPLNWNYGNYVTEFTGFNLASDGWKLDANNNTVLRVSGDARVNIPFNIFGSDFRTTGKTIEIEFATSAVLNYDATIISAWSGGRGINITAQKATLKSEQSEIFTQYKEDETVRITFSIEKRAENRLLSIYINGIMSGVTQYPDDDDFSQVDPVGISIGSNECTTDIYCIRIYNTNLSRYQILDNWIADTQDIETMIERYNRNNIFDDYGNISINKLPNYLPYMILEVSAYSDLPQYKGDKKTVSGRYVDPVYPERSFTFSDAQIDVQGTSSQYYSRKNYKIKFKNGFVVNNVQVDNYALRETSVPTNVFTFKADVASSEGANNVELVRLYDDINPYRTPVQRSDPRVRQGIEGYPIVMFYGEGEEVTFLGKYNFNNDKETAEVFGLYEGDESWEILQNNTQMVIWKDDDFSDGRWKDSFEARYPEDNEDIAKLQEFSSWIKSTDTTAVDNEEEKKARLEKFKNEFENYASLDGWIFNYIFTETFLMVDSRAKNAFPTYYKTDGIWTILPYDLDTAIGINNEGELKFGYELEDIDIVNGANVFNGQESVIYVNMREVFGDKIMEMYQTLRAGNIFNYPVINARFEEHQRTWGEAIFNEDARFKYIEPLINDGNKTYLVMAQGSKAEQRKWWLYNRFRYLDSKYNAGDSLEDYIMLRSYGVADITVTPYADIYASAKFDSVYVRERALRGSSYTLKNPLSGGRDAVISIYSASQLSSVGDLSGLVPGMADFHMATKLTSLKVGDGADDYENPNLNELTIGNLTLLQSLDVRKCTNLTQSIDLTGCTNIEHVYFDGSSITGIKLPNGGILKTLHLPNTVTALIIINQPQLKDFQMPSYENISTLRLEGVDQSVFDTLSIIDQIQEKSRIRLVGIDWTIGTAEEIFELMDKIDTFRGIDENGSNIDKPVISGVIHTGKITTNDLEEMYRRYPNITIDFEEISAIVRFFNEDELLYTTTIYNYGDIEDPIVAGIFDTPTKAEDDTSKYIYNSWDKPLTNIRTYTDFYAVYDEYKKYFVTFTDGRGNIVQVNGQDTNVYYDRENENIITVPTVSEYTEDIDGTNYVYRFSRWKNIETENVGVVNVSGDDYTITYEAQYIDSRVSIFTFMNEDKVHTILHRVVGETIERPDDPTKEATEFEYYTFIGWSLDGSTVIEPDTIAGNEDITYYAVYSVTDIYHTITFVNDGEVISTQSLQYGNKIEVPDDPTKESTEYNHYTFIGWTLDGETEVIPDIVGSGDMQFVAMYEESTRYYTVRFIGDGDVVLQTVQVTYCEDAVYTGSVPTNANDETFFGWAPEPVGIVEDTDCYAQFKYFITHRFIRRSITEITSENITVIGPSAFSYCQQLTTLSMPNVTIVSDNAFNNCIALTSINLPNVTNINYGVFSGCTKLPEIVLPNIDEIGQQVFNGCSKLTKVDLGKLTILNALAFNGCKTLESVIIRSDSVCTLINISAFNNTLIKTSTNSGYIYVPSNLVDSYKSASNWADYADKIRAIEDYPDICG